MDMVKAWNGKWHLFEDDLPPVPARPDLGWASYPVCLLKEGDTTYSADGLWGRYHRRSNCNKCRNQGVRWRRTPLPQPERQCALTACGQEVMVRTKATVAEVVFQTGIPVKLCSFCKPVFLRRMA